MKSKNYLNSINININTDFPYLFLNVINNKAYPQIPGFQVMHWHSDLQFIYVLEGEIDVQTLDEKVTVKKNNGIFINKNVVHLIIKNGLCHYNSFIFPDYFLKFYFNSPAGEFVNNIVEDNAIKLCLFDKNIDWCKNILENLGKLSLLEDHKDKFYVYQVLVLLSSIWLDINKNILLPEKSKKNIINERMHLFLDYIENNYSEKISLAQLAKSASVSKSECLRCFKKSLNTSPYKYLLEYRLAKAVELLKNTDESISEISLKTGFNQISHFGKYFREKTGVSPFKFRNNYKDA